MASNAALFRLHPDVRLVFGLRPWVCNRFLRGASTAWVTLSSDGKTAYLSNAVTNDVSAVNIKAMKEIALIPVGYVPKRNTTGMLVSE